MPNRSFIAIGHMSHDLGKPNRLGGGVSYAATAIARLGWSSVQIITKCPEGHPYIRELENEDIQVHRLPNRDSSYEKKITTFSLNYSDGNRTVFLRQRQENIFLVDIINFPVIPEGSLILAAPVIGEIDPKLFGFLAGRGKLVVTPQGYFREVNSDGLIIQRPWKDLKSLNKADAVILSAEDITPVPGGLPDMSLYNSIKENSRLLILTAGPDQIVISKRSERDLVINPFKLLPGEVRDYTGAGDVYAATFISEYFSGVPLIEAATAAALYAAYKIIRVGGGEAGLGTLPNLEQIREFTEMNYDRFREFNELNHLIELRPGQERK